MDTDPTRKRLMQATCTTVKMFLEVLFTCENTQKNYKTPTLIILCFFIFIPYNRVCLPHIINPFSVTLVTVNLPIVALIVR